MKNIIIMLVIGVCFLGCAVQEESFPAPETMGEACLDLGIAICNRGASCYGSYDVDTCRTDFIRVCCGYDGICDKDPGVDDGETWEECLESWASFSCTSLEAGGIPLECTEATI